MIALLTVLAIAVSAAIGLGTLYLLGGATVAVFGPAGPHHPMALIAIGALTVLSVGIAGGISWFALLDWYRAWHRFIARWWMP